MQMPKYLNVLVDESACLWEVTVAPLVADNPINGVGDFAFVDVDELTRLGEGSQDKGRQPGEQYPTLTDRLTYSSSSGSYSPYWASSESP